MNNSETIFLIIMAAVLLEWFALVTIWDIRDSKKYKQYIDSIKFGVLIFYLYIRNKKLLK